MNIFKYSIYIYTMGFNIGKALKDAGHSISKGFKDTGHFVEKNVGNVYHDAKSAVSYTGKHLIGDVDTLTNSASNLMSSPVLYIGIAVVVVVVLTKM